MTDAEIDEPLTLDLPKKKKRRRKEKKEVVAPKDDIDLNENGNYTYDQMLSRLYSFLEKDPTYKKRVETVMKLPDLQLVRVGGKRFSIVNFMELCRHLNRDPEHCSKYIQTELGTHGTFSEDLRFTLKGKFKRTQIETVIRKYVTDYIQCKNCGSTETDMRKEKRLVFISCNSCLAKRTAQAMKKGFLAKVRK